MPKEGDFVVIDYTVSTNGKVFDTTKEDVAKSNNIFQEGRTYRPLAVCIGAGDVIVGLEKVLKDVKKGDKKAFTVEPKEAYGERNPELIKIVPLKAFQDNKINPVPGMVLDIDGMPARIQSVSGGRVRVDFNHELAGKTLEFSIEVIDVLTKPEDKVKALASNFFEEGSVDIKVEGDKVIVKPKRELLRKRNYPEAKQLFIAHTFILVRV